ncbi:MAG TPA: fibronectin type III domain-containing protein [Candidatus Binatia bacterium]|nr:fibronectin type III domain-containing protein [Candidatus Binatia bacterium]
MPRRGPLTLMLLIVLLPSVALAALKLAAVDDLLQIAGVWEGELRVGSRRIPIVVAIEADGRAVIDGKGQRRNASLKVANGQVEWLLSPSNAVSRLFRDGDARVLRLTCDDGSCLADLRPSARVAKVAEKTGAAAAGRSQLAVSWAAQPDLRGFIVDRRSAGDETSRVVARLPADRTSFVDVSLPEGSRYCYRVHAYNAAGMSEPSAEVCAPAPPPPSATRGHRPSATASTPPPAARAMPIRDAARLVGAWQGQVTAGSAVTALAVTFKRDGTADWKTLTMEGTARFHVEGGRVRWRASTGDATGDLYEGPPRPVLRFTCDDGTCSSELRPLP